MKHFYILVAAVFLTKALSAQSISETFNSGLASLTANAWKFSNITVETSPALLLQGQCLATKSLGTSVLATPYCDCSGTIDVSVDYSLSEKLNGNATRKIEIGLMDVAGNFTSSAAIVLDKNSTHGNAAAAVNTLKANELSAGGTKKFVVRVDAGAGEGRAYVILDNLKIAGNFVYHYGTTPLNSAPTAVNDFFFSSVLAPFSGTVLANDIDPNAGEAATNAVLVTAPSEPGAFVFNNDGTFSFTPGEGFKGGPVIFTYKATDNGCDPLQSNLAAVVINYAENTSLSAHSAGFKNPVISKAH